MASGSITGKFTKGGAHSSSLTTVDRFLAGEGSLSNSSITAYVAFLYGLNLESLRNLPNLRITGFSISFKGGRYNTTFASRSSLDFRLVTSFKTSGTDTSTYTSITNDSINITEGSVSPSTVKTFTQNNLPEVLTWMNNNLQSLLNGYTQNTFGIRMYLAYAQLVSLDFTINYEYSGSSSNVYVGSQKINHIYLGSQEVSKIYIGSTEIYNS